MLHTDLHTQQPVLFAGEPLERAQAALILIHGRGASAEDILTVHEALALPGFAYLAPQAANHTWYPNPFMSPLASNEPFLSSALRRIETLVASLEQAGLTADRVALLGFSQGASLSLEFVARHPRRYLGIAGLSGGLIGPEIKLGDEGSLGGTPVFLGCSDVDPYIPRPRVEASAEALRKMGGEVTMRLYPRMGHTINDDEIQFVRTMLNHIADRDSSLRSE